MEIDEKNKHIERLTRKNNNSSAELIEKNGQINSLSQKFDFQSEKLENADVKKKRATR